MSFCPLLHLEMYRKLVTTTNTKIRNSLITVSYGKSIPYSSIKVINHSENLEKGFNSILYNFWKSRPKSNHFEIVYFSLKEKMQIHIDLNQRFGSIYDFAIFCGALPKDTRSPTENVWKMSMVINIWENKCACYI